MVLHYHKGPLLPTAPSVLAEGNSERDTEKLWGGYGMTPSTRRINGDFLFALAIFYISETCAGGAALSRSPPKG